MRRGMEITRSGAATLKEVKEIERHFHNYERWFGLSGQQDPAIQVAEPILTCKTPFRIDAGNDTWGNWVQILGINDTPAQAGMLYFDIHRINFTGFETNNSTHGIQIASGASGLAALAAGTYTEFILRTGGGNTFIGPIDIMDKRIPVGTKMWIRNWAHGVVTSWLDFYIGLHEYPE